MAEKEIELDSISCKICWDVLKDPVTTPCGHSYCMDCLQCFWDKEKPPVSCPECKQTFRRRPDLLKNTMLACLVEELKTGLLPMESTEMYGEIRRTSLDIQQIIQEGEEDVKLLRQERRSDVKQQIKTEQETGVRRVKDHQEKLEQRITDLRGKVADLEKVFLQAHRLKNTDLEDLFDSIELTSSDISPTPKFEEVKAAVSELRDRITDALRETEISKMETQDVSLTNLEPETRVECLKYARRVTMDPNTINNRLRLSMGNRLVTLGDKELSYRSNVERFTKGWQALSRQSLTGRCYFEVEIWGAATIALSYKSISRDLLFEDDSLSWKVFCCNHGPTFEFLDSRKVDMGDITFGFNDLCSYSLNDHTMLGVFESEISGPQSSRVGVYLDHDAGILCFYRLSETMTLLHRVETRFTEPLHAGVALYGPGGPHGDRVEFSKLSERK
ncbi:tripartite motif-containing protein 16-like protein [Trematomus bernacchii]|uniref:tripartite motif-containing protein 16-like protein n=1 Tax=Trematomus bernacchii TaxID=40690 RepID=UPI00146D1913|nr:tripartite motif-containing protein 16-like protein [Trematomus bernacchii]